MFKLQRSILKAGIKIVNFVVLFSILLSNGIGVPTVKAAGIKPAHSTTSSPALVLNKYTPPMFTHPQPRVSTGSGKNASAPLSNQSLTKQGIINTSTKIQSSSDESAKIRTVLGTPQLGMGQYKFGTASVLFSGNSDDTCPTSGDLVIINGESCTLNAGSYTFNSVSIQTGGTLVLNGDTLSNQGVTINVGSLTVENGGTIMSDGLGYGGGVGPGTPGTSGAGAGHGGIGGGWGDETRLR
jgi:hypothetical protein